MFLCDTGVRARFAVRLTVRWSVVNSSTTRPGSSTGSGRRNTALVSVKMAVLAPIPRPSDSRATAVNPGLRASVRAPYFRSCQRSIILVLSSLYGTLDLGFGSAGGHERHDLAKSDQRSQSDGRADLP